MTALATIGHNRSPFELSQDEADGLFLEASNWCDGAPIETQEQDDAVSSLLSQIKAAIKRADDRRKDEAKPHDEAKAAIQARYNTLIGDNKTAGKGKLVLAAEACQKARTPWLVKVEEAKRIAAEEARAAEAAARKKAAEAFEAARAAQDLESKARAEILAKEVAAAERVAAKAEKATAIRTGLKTVITAQVVNMQEFAKWAWSNDRAALNDHFSARAISLARDGRRDIPGVEITETREAR